jgi:cytochrome c biogenesis protein CcmG, thiol:disulfide interchange protein DsbE
VFLVVQGWDDVTKPWAFSRAHVFSSIRALALFAVCALFGALVYRIVQDPRSHLIASVNAHRRPPAPDVRLAVIWPQTATWPRELRAAVGRGTFRLRNLRGYPVVVNFWASWCSPCRREAVLFAKAAEAERGRVVFVGVDVHDLSSDARHFLRAQHVPYVGVRSGESITERFGLVGLPETFYMDRRGRIQAVTQGELSASSLQRQLDRIDEVVLNPAGAHPATAVGTARGQRASFELHRSAARN